MFCFRFRLFGYTIYFLKLFYRGNNLDKMNWETQFIFICGIFAQLLYCMSNIIVYKNSELVGKKRQGEAQFNGKLYK